MKPYKGTIDQLTFPKLASRKIDGIRCIKQGGRALTASLKPVPNRFIRETIERSCAPDGFDGELVLAGAGWSFQDITSAVMSEDGKPPFLWLVFDQASQAPYHHRLSNILDWFETYGDNGVIRLLPVRYVWDKEIAQDVLDSHLAEGAEGVVFRDPNGAYKAGRSTLTDQGMFAVKPFVDSEARVLGFVEQMHNTNPAFTDERGLAKRSRSMDGLLGLGTLGTLHVQDCQSGEMFDIGTGFTSADRLHIWSNQSRYLGATCTYKFQRVTDGGKPRHPVFKGWRAAEDQTTTTTQQQKAQNK